MLDLLGRLVGVTRASELYQLEGWNVYTHVKRMVYGRMAKLYTIVKP
jgi:hypothetical protein